MRVVSLKTEHYRNLRDVDIRPAADMNVLFGDNAHGKTNLLEAIWMMTGGKSFRGSKDHELVAFQEKAAVVKTEFYAEGRHQTVTMTVDRRRKAVLNGNEIPTVKRLTGKFCAVIFSPDHLSLIKEGPEGRRRFADAACCQLRPMYLSALVDYTRVLTQRNMLIKAVKNGDAKFDENLMDVFDERLAQSGAVVRDFRTKYIDRLSPLCSAVYDGLSNGREAMTLSYTPKEQTAEELATMLKDRRQTDFKMGYTTAGPHRDDLDIMIGDKPARAFASQGQQRSAVLALKLSEATLLSDGYGEKPVILLDDVMSELDSHRQDYILNHIDGFQVFITCCDRAAVDKLKGGNLYTIRNGVITQQ